MASYDISFACGHSENRQLLGEQARFDAAFGGFYRPVGRPAKPTRLMVGLHYLKHVHDLSDEEVVDRWVENPYWRAPRAHVSGMRKRKEELNESRAFCCEGA